MLASKTTEVKYRVKPVTRLPYPAGIYSSTMRYTCSANVAPYVVFQPNTAQDAVRYVMNKVGTWLGTEQGMTPAEDYAKNGENATWLPFEHFNAIEIELALIQFAKIGQAIFYDQYTISEHGKDTNNDDVTNYKDFNAADPMNPENAFRPNICLNWQTGEAFFWRSNMFASRSVGVGSVELGTSQIAIPLTSNFVALTGEWNGSSQWGRVLAYVPEDRESCVPNWDYMEFTIQNASNGPVVLNIGNIGEIWVGSEKYVINTITIGKLRHVNLMFKVRRYSCGIIDGIRCQAGRFYVKNVHDFDISRFYDQTTLTTKANLTSKSISFNV